MTVREYLRSFAVLKETRREYWGIQAISVLDCIYAFASVTVATIFMSTSLGFSDIAAGAVITWLGISTSIFLACTGPIIDRLGLKRSLYAALGGALVVRATLVASVFWTGMPHRAAVFVGCLVVGCLPGSIRSTVNHVSNRRFTSAKAQGAGFNVWYIGVNVGAVIAGLLIDYVHLTLSLDYAYVFLFGAVDALVALPIAALAIRNDASYDPSAPPERKKGMTWSQLAASAREVVRHSAFARMMCAVTLMSGVRAAILYWSVLSPKYWLRTIGHTARVGLLTSINPLVIVIGLLLLVPIINRFSTFRMLTVGALISAASFVPLAVPWHLVHPDPARAYFLMSATSMIIFAFGEMLFSPRLSHYVMAIAPNGQEGAYASFASLPWFFGKTVAGFLSGVMLTRWCPETRIIGNATMTLHDAVASRALPYVETPEMMWALLGLLALIGPLTMLAFRKWFAAGMRATPTSN